MTDIAIIEMWFARKTRKSIDLTLAYTALCILKANKQEGKEIVTTRGLYYTLLQNNNFNRAYLERLRRGMDELVRGKWIDVSPIKCDYLVDWSSFHHTKKCVCYVPVFAIRQILDGKFTSQNYEILKHFIFLCSIFEPMDSNGLEDCYVGKASLDELAHIGRTTSKEIIKYNKILYDKHIIYCYNRYLIYNMDTTQKDFYSFYWEQDQLEEYAKRHYEGKYVPLIDENKKRKITQMYNAVANGKEYDRGTMIFLYRYIKRENQYWNNIFYDEENYKWTVRRDAKAKVKSLIPFRKYKYIYEEMNN